MALTNNLKKIVDLPIFELCSQAPTATAAASSTTTSDEQAKYMYYLTTSSLFYRYDTEADVWQQLASPMIAPSTITALKYSTYNGYRGNCLNATLNTMTIAGLSGNILKGQTIRITDGVGVGQERIITNVSQTAIVDQGIVTGASNLVITDTTKRWEINQFIGYQVRIIFNTGSSQVRKILYNDATNLYFYDVNYQQLEAWNNTYFSGAAPYVAPIATAGSQSHYIIESCDITTDTNWVVVPDDSSSFTLFSGGIWLLASLGSAPWSSFQYYDVLSDTWTVKTALGGLLLASLGTDFSIERTGRVAGNFLSRTATSAGARTITDTTLTGPTAMVVDYFVGYQMKITAGTGLGQKNRIVANGTNYFEIESPWIVVPDSTSIYAIYADNDKIYLIGNASSQMFIYHVEDDYWTTGEAVDEGQTRNMSCQFVGQEAYGITAAVRNTGGITSLSATPTAGGLGYVVGDLFNITTGGTVGKGRVEAISAGGVVASVSLYSAGLTYTTGTGKVTTIISGAGNNLLTVNIIAVGTVGRVTLASNNNFYKGDVISISGCTEAAWNNSYPIIAIDSLTTFDVVTTAIATATATITQSTTLIVDSIKNWVINEHVGKLITLNIAGPAPTTQVRRITSNTATTITVAIITAGVNGTSRYSICDPQSFGRDVQWKVALKSAEGRATSGSSTTLVDNTKSWFTNQWLGYKVRILAGTGVGSEVVISANDVTTLTITSPGFTPDTTTKYIIMDTFGTVTGNAALTTLGDTTKNWTINQWSGKRVIITSGTGQRQELIISSNTANVLTFGSGIAPDITSTYTILSLATRAIGTQINWVFGCSTLPKGRYLVSQRGGGANTVDIYDIVTGTWNITYFIGPQTETFSTGTMTAYDGKDILYIQKDATGRIFAIDVNNMAVSGALQLTDTHGGTVIGNRMEIVTTPDGLKYLYIMQHSGTKMWRALIF